MGEELESITLRAGMDPLRVAAHINGNFANYPALASIEFGALRLIDVYNMEGAVNEHVTSTGLNDCETVYWNCHDEHGVKTCNSQLIIPSKDHDTARFSRNIKDCNLHNGERDKTFDGLWRKFLGAQTTYKVNGKRWVTHLGLESAEAQNEFPVNDFNGIGGGTISGAFGFLIDACITCDSSVAAKDPWTGSHMQLRARLCTNGTKTACSHLVSSSMVPTIQLVCSGTLAHPSKTVMKMGSAVMMCVQVSLSMVVLKCA